MSELESTSTLLPTAFGVDLHCVTWKRGRQEIVSVSRKGRTWPTLPLVRIHSACLFGEVFHSLLCDCRKQVDYALSAIARDGGCLIYLFQEGRGAGLFRKTAAMEFERTNDVDTVSAYEHFGLKPDQRDYSAAIAVMKELRLPKALRLMTNNPSKIAAVEGAGFRVNRVEPDIALRRKTLNALLRKQHALGQILYSFPESEE